MSQIFICNVNFRVLHLEIDNISPTGSNYFFIYIRTGAQRPVTMRQDTRDLGTCVMSLVLFRPLWDTKIKT